MNPSNVIPLSGQRGQLDYRTIRIYDDLLGPAPSEGEGPVLRLTEEGLAYYGWWFRKYGFALTSDANAFFEAIKGIGRSLREEQLSGSPDQLFPQSAVQTLPPAARKLAEGLNAAVCTGALPAAWADKREAARQERQSGQGTVVAFNRK